MRFSKLRPDLETYISSHTKPNQYLPDQIGEEGAHHIGAHDLHEEVIEIRSDDGGGCVKHECLPSFIVVNGSRALCRSKCVKKDG